MSTAAILDMAAPDGSIRSRQALNTDWTFASLEDMMEFFSLNDTATTVIYCVELLTDF
jgi:hypothetical protein